MSKIYSRFNKSRKTAENQKFLESYLRDLDCPRSLCVWLLFSSGEHLQLSELECKPDHYLDYEQFEVAFKATKFLSKSEFLSISKDIRVSRALKGFFAAEDACRVTNRKIVNASEKDHMRYAGLVLRVQRKISTILGDFDAEDFYDSCGWGPGVSQLVKGDTSAPNKFHLENGITSAAFDLVHDNALVSYPNWWPGIKFQVVDPVNKVITVPKNSKTERVIAVEPGLNLWFQKGCGRLVRERLRRYGVNLNSAEKNQQFAMLGSKGQSIATVDFSAASDTISEKVVEALLPTDWYHVLDALRCTHGEVDGRVLRYEKFSSMGNGYTFELESLIFYAVAFVVTTELGLDPKVISVFGDDVTIPVAAFNLFRDFSAYLGFTVNTQKSYFSGYFREACGAYYWDGACVKPFFFKKEFYDEASLYVTANAVRLRNITGSSAISDVRHRATWQFLRKLLVEITNRDVKYVPLHGGTGLVVNFDEARPTFAREYMRGFWYRCLHFLPRFRMADHHGLLLARLCDVGNTDRASGNNYPAARQGRYTVVKVYTPTWPNIGPWL